MRGASFPVTSPQCAGSPAGSEETAKTMLPQKNQKETRTEQNDQMDKNALYDIISAPLKGSARLTLRLSRLKCSDVVQSEEHPLRADDDSDHDTDLMNDNNRLSEAAQDLSQQGTACPQVSLLPNVKEAVSGVVYYDDEMDTLAEIERMEQSASERDQCSKEVQDKGEFLSLPCAF